MKKFTSSEVKQRFGMITTSAIKAPVIIEKHGNPQLVVISYDDYIALKEKAGEPINNQGLEG